MISSKNYKQKNKHLIICGDINVAHKDIDVKNPNSHINEGGFTTEEKENMSKLLNLNLTDSFRHIYPNKTDSFPFWRYQGARKNFNDGWRLDYILVSDKIAHRIKKIGHDKAISYSDHCPVTLFLDI